MLLCKVLKGSTFALKHQPTDPEKQRFASEGFYRQFQSVSAAGGLKLDHTVLKYPEYVVYDPDQGKGLHQYFIT